MCVLCALIIKDKLTPREARRALGEMSRNKDISEEHIEEVNAIITEKEEKENGDQK